MTVGWLDRVVFQALNGGTADYRVYEAIHGYQTPVQAGAVDGRSYGYVAQLTMGDPTEWEVGRGLYDSTTQTFARTNVLFNSDGTTTPHNFTQSPVVMITALAEDMGTGGGGTPGGLDTQVQFNDAGSFGGDSEFIWNKTQNRLTTQISSRAGGAPALGTATGNLFVGHTAIGNYADINTDTFAPGDPTNVEISTYPIVLEVNEYFNRDFSGSAARGIWADIGVRQTVPPTDDTFAAAIGGVITINSDNAGSVEARAGDFTTVNFSPVAMGNVLGIGGEATNLGTADVDVVAGARFTAGSFGGTVTNATIGGWFNCVQDTGDGPLADSNILAGGYFVADINGGTPLSVVGGSFEGVVYGTEATTISSFKGFNAGASQQNPNSSISEFIGADATTLTLFGTCTDMYGGRFLATASSGDGNTRFLGGGWFEALYTPASARSATLVFGGKFPTTVGANGTVNSLQGLYVPTPVNSGAVTNAFGLNIETWDGVGTTNSYNIYSRGTTLITPGSTAGGNLFVGHTAIGNSADVDISIGDPADPDTPFSAPAVLSVAEYYNGDFTDLAPVSIASITAVNHVGAGSAIIGGVTAYLVTADTSSGDIELMNIMSFEGHGNGTSYVTEANGVYGEISLTTGDHLSGLRAFAFGTTDSVIDSFVDGVHGVGNIHSNATSPKVSGGYFAADVADTAVATSAYGAELKIIKGVGATITNAYGLYINDSSGIGGTTSYNILSNGTRGGTAPALASTVGGNLFVGHTAIGNYADVDTPYFAPGDPAIGQLANYSSILIFSDYITGDFSTLNGVSGLSVFPGFKNTGSAFNDTAFGINCRPTVNSDNAVTITGLVGIETVPIVASPTVNILVGVSATVGCLETGAVGDAIIIGLNTDEDRPVVCDNLVGLDIGDMTQNSTVSTSCYNIYSRGTSFITPASTAGGNLFVGHTAIGNYADVDASFDFGGSSSSPVVAPLLVSEFYTGDLSVTRFNGSSIVTNVKHTGTANGVAVGDSIVISTDSTSTGPLDEYRGSEIIVFNNGSGNVGLFRGLAMVGLHFGSGTIDEFTGGNFAALSFSGSGAITDFRASRLEILIQNTVTNASGYNATAADISGGTITNFYNLKLEAPVLSSGGTITNNYGVYIEDQSGIGGTISENIRSKGSSSINHLEGKLTLDRGANLTSANLGTPTNGSTLTIDTSNSPIQYLTNNVAAFTIAAPAADGSCFVQIENGASAGTISFSGFTVGASTGDALDTTNTHKFTVSIWRINGTSSYMIKALQ